LPRALFSSVAAGDCFAVVRPATDSEVLFLDNNGLADSLGRVGLDGGHIRDGRQTSALRVFGLVKAISYQ
jgi:hypothetical protein